MERSQNMRWLDKLEDQLAKPGALPRRSFFGWIAKSAVAIAAASAGIAGFAKTAFAGNYYCCDLVYPNNFCTTYDGSSCSNSTGCSGSSCSTDSAYTWLCSYGHCTWLCGECTGCCCSYAYQLCSPGCPCEPGRASVDALSKFLPLRAPGECH